MRSILLTIGMTFSMTFFAAQAFAVPYLESEQFNLEGGLSVLNLFVNGDDGQSLSFFVDLTFTSTEFNEVPVNLGDSSVDITSSDHFLWDNDPAYVANRGFDSFFYERPSDSWTALPPCNGVAHSSSGSYQVCLGTSAGEGFARLALGQLVVPTGETVFFEGEIFRSGSSFGQSGAFSTVPEPSSAVLLGGGLLLLGARRSRS
ncbi:MAG: PEP-CTERM sorting domain-containing protein [Proteobacteria bacterium]|nr:PEP-CTERM sorting domain-containing protein [Pseudomonadota bacterium]